MWERNKHGSRREVEVGESSSFIAFINVIKSTWSLLNEKKNFFFLIKRYQTGRILSTTKRKRPTLRSPSASVPRGRGRASRRLRLCFCCGFSPYSSSQRGKIVFLKSSVNKMQTDRVFPSCWKSRTQSPESSKAGALRLGEDFEDHVLKWEEVASKDRRPHTSPKGWGEKQGQAASRATRHELQTTSQFWLPLLPASS